jgi:transcriptional regulator with GAF, ATPase, and Fis domain/tetratricopeptide (TPR) repeat protein
LLRAEFAVLRALHHPALVEARDLMIHAREPYLVEPRINGERLAVWARWREARQVVGCVARVAHALAHMHVRGLVHLDASPENILVQSDGSGLLVDLGLARAVGTVGAAGTPGFVAPEVLAGEPVTPAADVFTLAATIAYVIDGDSTREWGRPQANHIADAQVREVLEECLHSAPASRPNALALARRFTELAGLEGASLERPLASLPLCAREAELTAFDAWLAEGRGVCQVVGGPGVGKSALLRACVDRAKIAGFCVFDVVASAPDALETLATQVTSAADESVIHELGTDLGSVIRHPRLPKTGGAVRTGHERAQIVVLALDILSRYQPVLVAVDDAQQAGPFMAPAMAIWCERQVDGGARLLITQHRESRGIESTILLSPLDRSGVEEVLRVAHAEERPAAEAEHILATWGGAPARIVQVLAHLATRGGSIFDIELDEDGSVCPLPEPLASVALIREAIPEPVVRLLLADAGAGVLEQALRDGALRLLSAGTTPVFRVPALARRQAAGRATLADAARVAQACEQAGFPLLAAPLYARAQEAGRALALLEEGASAHPDARLRALGAVALELGADALDNETLREWVMLAANAAEFEPLQTAAATLSRRGQADWAVRWVAACQVKLGRYHEALDTLAQMNDGDDGLLCGSCLDPETTAVRARALFFAGQAAEARDLAEASWQGASGGARADLLDVLGHSAFALGDATRARQYLELALEEARAGDDPRIVSRAEHALAIVLHRCGDLESAAPLYRRALAQAETLSRVSRTVNLATLLQDSGELAEAQGLYRDALSQAVALANVREQARVGVNLANLEVRLGNLPSAVSLATRTLEICEQAELSHAAAMAALVLSEAQLERQDLQRAALAIERATQLLAGVDDRVAQAELALLTARLAAARGAFRDATTALDSVDVDTGAAHITRRLAFWRARLRLASGAPADELMMELAERAVTLAEGHPESYWRALAVLARVYTRAGDTRVSEIQKRGRQALEALRARLPDVTTYQASASRRELASWIETMRCPTAQVGSQLSSVAYRRVLAINRRLAREHEIGPLLELIVDAAIELLGAERGFVVLRDGEGVRIAVARNFDRQSLEDGRQRISRSIASESLRMGETILTTNAQQDQRFAGIASVAMLKVRSVICVPLRGMARDEDPIIGALYLDHRFQERAFTDDDVELCESFADQAAIALDNVRLFEQTREQERKLAAQNERLERLNTQLQREAAQYAEEAEAALRRLREEGPTVGVGKGFERIVGCGDKLREALRLVDRFADTDVPVVIYGESGTGKELIARAIHERSSRAHKPFVSINCGAIPENLIESELFGYTKGAFSGAVRDKAGLLKAAEGGTLLLDEIGEMPLTMQVKLLRVLQEREYRPVGATSSVSADVRVVSASNENLEAQVADGRFREDLFYRLRVVEIRVPPLRERRGDIPMLVDHFCRQITGEPAEVRFSKDALARLLGHDWPGNVRELENEVRRALALADSRVELEDLSERFQAIRASGAAILADTTRGSLKEITEGFERQVLLATLRRTGWNVRQAARELGLSRAALYTRLNKFRITRDDRA